MGMAEATGLAALAGFRRDFHACLQRRADALFELADAVLCAGGPVVSLPELSPTPEHGRGHGALYDALACGQVAGGPAAPHPGRVVAGPATNPAASPSRWTSAPGCVRMPPPATTGCSATSMGAARAARR